MVGIFDISNFEYLSNRIHSLKYQRSTTSGCRDIGIKVRVCGKSSVPLSVLAFKNQTIYFKERTNLNGMIQIYNVEENKEKGVKMDSRESFVTKVVVMKIHYREDKASNMLHLMVIKKRLDMGKSCIKYLMYIYHIKYFMYIYQIIFRIESRT